MEGSKGRFCVFIPSPRVTAFKMNFKQVLKSEMLMFVSGDFFNVRTKKWWC